MPNIELNMPILEAFCRQWKVRELALFGSVLRSDFSPESDIDVLVTFEPDAPWSLWDLMDMQEQLANLLGRRVDLIEADALRNPFRRHEILRTKKVVYAA
jgi:predicted nucleotidyltransferase